MVPKIVSKLNDGGISKDLPRHKIGFYGLIVIALVTMVILVVF